MKQLSTLALVLAFGATGTQAEQLPVWITFSGFNIAMQIILQSGAAPAGDINLAGHSSLGVFTWHEVAATAATPSGTCGGPNLRSFPNVAGAGVFRFRDGSLLTTKLTGGSACVEDYTSSLMAGREVLQNVIAATRLVQRCGPARSGPPAVNSIDVKSFGRSRDGCS